MQDTKSINRQFKKLDKIQAILEIESGKLQEMISPFLDFGEHISDGFGITYQPSDGFVLEFQALNARLSGCIEIIKEKGKLSFEDYEKLTI